MNFAVLKRCQSDSSSPQPPQVAGSGTIQSSSKRWLLVVLGLPLLAGTAFNAETDVFWSADTTGGNCTRWSIGVVPNNIADTYNVTLPDMDTAGFGDAFARRIAAS